MSTPSAASPVRQTNRCFHCGNKLPRRTDAWYCGRCDAVMCSGCWWGADTTYHTLMEKLGGED